MNINRFHTSTACCIILLAGVLYLSPALKSNSDGNSDNHGSQDWIIAGQNFDNSRSQPTEEQISVNTVASLQAKWTFTTGGDVSATPTVASDAVYFPDWAGNLFAVNKSTGKLIWSHQISDYNNFPGSIARVSPAISNDLLVLGDIQSASAPHNGANVIAVDRRTGNLRWITPVETHPAAEITGSPVILGNVVYVGVSSSEESLATNPAYPCCSFRGSIVALDLLSGRVKWQTYDMPDNKGLPTGYSGGAVWQPFAIDPARGTLYAGTGNNYEVPQDVKNCLASSTMATASSCFAADDLFDAALALDLNTGRIKWSKRIQGEDVWTVACIVDPNPVACPEPNSPDFDFSGSGPNLLPHMIGFGQKSGMYWAFNPGNGNLLWSTMVGPGSTLGGIEWGTASDGRKIFVAISNGAHKPYPLIDGTSTTGGAWSALDAQTGKILWQTADPTLAIDSGAVSYANGVVFAPSFSGNMNALDASNGKILWTFPSGGSVIDGPSIVHGAVYWGSGYKHISPGIANNKVYAFTTNGKNNDGDSDGNGH
ncbi:MAG TPA: PQQ-binding-like beta-propeller repeat protein [Bryobacteraceae bacterium]